MEADLMECRIPLKLIGRCRDICERLITDATDRKTGHLAVKEWSTPKIMVIYRKNVIEMIVQ